MSDSCDVNAAQNLCQISYSCNSVRSGNSPGVQAPPEVINNCVATLCSIPSLANSLTDTGKCLSLLSDQKYSDCQRVIACVPGNYNPGGGPDSSSY